ncbi:MAG: lysophospholipid acyltransferase family protein [Anaerolineales bacterium]
MVHLPRVRMNLETFDGYVPEEWASNRRLLRALLHHIGFRFLARIDAVDGVEHVPAEGALILLMNHLAFVDSLAVIHSLKRDVVPLAKVEVYQYPLINIFPRLWGVIPVRREGMDLRAIRMALNVLDTGDAILIAPEGTRSPQLQRGKEGIAYLAARSQAILQPVALEGSPGFPTLPFTRRWRGEGIRVKFGRPFRLRTVPQRLSREQLREITDESMLMLAELLPEHRRGYYAAQIGKPLQWVIRL